MRSLPQPSACRPRNATAYTLLRDAAHTAFTQRSRIHRRAPDVCRCIATGAAGLLWRSHRVLLISEICSQQQASAAHEQQQLLHRALSIRHCARARASPPSHVRGVDAARCACAQVTLQQEAGGNATQVAPPPLPPPTIIINVAREQAYSPQPDRRRPDPSA